MKALILSLFAAVALAQITPPTTMQFVTSAPAGACASANLPIQYVTTTGSMYGCVSGTWTSVGGGGGGSGTVTSITGGRGLSGGTITTSGTLAVSEAVNAQTGPVLVAYPGAPERQSTGSH